MNHRRVVVKAPEITLDLVEDFCTTFVSKDILRMPGTVKVHFALVLTQQKEDSWLAGGLWSPSLEEVESEVVELSGRFSLVHKAKVDSIRVATR